MSESYLIEGDQLQDITDLIWGAQSFRPTITHNLLSVVLHINKTQDFYAPQVEIWSQLPDPAHPELCLSHQELYTDWKELPLGIIRCRAKMYPVTLQKGILYYLCLNHKTAIPPPHHQWQFDTIYHAYTRGARYLSINAGLTWSVKPSTDWIFAEYGSPPAIPIPTTPPLGCFLVTDLAWAYWQDGASSIASTDNPCFLTLYTTNERPKTITTWRTVRGVKIKCGCTHHFIVKDHYIQIEPGDTLLHTFNIPNWPFCQKVYLVFKGTAKGMPITSVSPIFEKHISPHNLFCNLGFEDYSTTPDIPPCWEDDSYLTPDPIIERDTTHVKEGQYSCKITGPLFPHFTGIKQIVPALLYRGKTLKFTIWRNAWISCPVHYSIKQTGPGAWEWRSAFIAAPGWYSSSYTHLIHPLADYIEIHLATHHFLNKEAIVSWDNITIEEV